MPTYRVPEVFEQGAEDARLSDEDEKGAEAKEDGAAVGAASGEEVNEAEEADEEPEVAA